jgi:hypothetical protein
MPSLVFEGIVVVREKERITCGGALVIRFYPTHFDTSNESLELAPEGLSLLLLATLE